MNIAITSPEKFKFQDLVCIDLMFRFLRRPAVEFFPEHQGGEDGLLSVPGAAGSSHFELQVKGSFAKVDIDAIAQCLIHYPARKDRNSLLERIFGDPTRYALLVFSGRCDDAASVYVADPQWAGEAHPASRITSAVVGLFREAYRRADPEGKVGGKLHSGRKAHAQSFIDSADPARLQEALQRLIVIELRREKEVVTSCLSEMHGIPLDRRPDVLNRIRDHIGVAKVQAINAFPQVLEILAEGQKGNMRPANYALRGQEDAWIAELSRSRALLMSGRTRVGKSDAARWVAAEFALKGYEVRQVFDPQAAERFLQEPGEGPRLVLLDDPLNFDTSTANSALTLIEKLIKRLLPHQVLIVAQGQETLLDVTNKTAVAELLTAGKSWIDLSEHTPEFLESVWLRQASEMEVPPEMLNEVSQALRSGNLMLEPGCLTHLAAQHHQLPTNPTLHDYVNLAREDAAALGRRLRNEHCENLLLAMAIGSSSTEPIEIESIAFILGDGGSRLPAQQTTRTWTMTHSDVVTDHLSSLNYEFAPRLKMEDEQFLEFLETHRIATITQDGVSFSHQFYRAAGVQAASTNSTAAKSRLLRALNRALFCTSSRVSKAAARNLETLYRQLRGHPEQKNIVLAASDAISTCRFIATRDLCLAFLIRELDDLPEEIQSELPSWVSQVDIDLTSVVWVNGECLSFEGITDYETLFGMYTKIEETEVANTLAALRRIDQALPQPQDLSLLIRYFEQNPSSMQPDDMKALLSCDEAILRAAACNAWLSASRQHDTGIWDRIIADNHPILAKEALKGALYYWRNLEQASRDRISAKLAMICATPAGAAAVLPELTVFGREESTGPIPTTPWDLFVAIFPGVMRSLPGTAIFNDARLYDVVKKAVKHVDLDAALTIVDSVIDWALATASKGTLLSDYQAGVATLLLDATSGAPDARKNRVRKLLCILGTAATLRVVADLVSGWELLREDEREVVLELLASDRPDKIWLRAAAITRSVVPTEVINTAAGHIGALGSAESILQLPQELLSAAVLVYLGEPQPLWWIGTHHSKNPVWNEVIKLVALDGMQPTFRNAWSGLSHTADEDVLCDLITRIDVSLLDRVFCILLAIKAGSNQEYMCRTWSALLRRRDAEKIPAEWFNQISECLPLIVDALWDLPKWLEAPYLAGAKKMVQSDLVLLQLVEAVDRLDSRAASSELLSLATKTILLFLEKAPPRLYKTCDYLIKKFNTNHWQSDKAVQKLAECRTKIFEDRRTVADKYKFDSGTLQNWTSP